MFRRKYIYHYLKYFSRFRTLICAFVFCFVRVVAFSHAFSLFRAHVRFFACVLALTCVRCFVHCFAFALFQLSYAFSLFRTSSRCFVRVFVRIFADSYAVSLSRTRFHCFVRSFVSGFAISYALVRFFVRCFECCCVRCLVR